MNYTVKQIGQLMRSTNTRIAYVEFVKRDDTVRKMFFTTRWIKEIYKDGQLPYNAENKGITIVRDIHLPYDNCLRAVRWDSVLHLCVNGITVNWNSNDGTYATTAKERRTR